MARRNPPAKWVLPSVVDPPRICFQIEVPNEPHHLAAFRGAILNLAAAYKWQDDPAHTAKRVAAVWDDIYTKIRTCETVDCGDQGITLEDFMSQQIRLKPGDPCIIQMWCIDDWQDWYDPRTCISSGAVQNPPGGTLESGSCQEFSIRVDGNGRAILPVPVEAGYTIQILSAEGGWWDGNVLHAWNCPSGLTYAFGACVSAGVTDAGSPIPSLSIGRLVAQIDGVYYDAYNTTIGVPSGTPSTDVFFQMNDASLSDNAGSISVRVKVCASATDAVNLTYGAGSGLTSVPFGTPFVITADNVGSATYNVDFFADQCFDLTVISMSGWTSKVPPNSSDGLLSLCGAHSFTTPYLDPFTASFTNLDGWDCTSSTPYTAVIRLDIP